MNAKGHSAKLERENHCREMTTAPQDFSDNDLDAAIYRLQERKKWDRVSELIAERRRRRLT